MPTLTDYVFVAQDEIAVRRCVRRSANQWLMTDYTQPTDVLTFASLGVTLSIGEIYAGIAFEK